MTDTGPVSPNVCVVCGALIHVEWEESGPLRRAIQTCPVDWRHNAENAKAPSPSHP